MLKWGGCRIWLLNEDRAGGKPALRPQTKGDYTKLITSLKDYWEADFAQLREQYENLDKAGNNPIKDWKVRLDQGNQWYELNTALAKIRVGEMRGYVPHKRKEKSQLVRRAPPPRRRRRQSGSDAGSTTQSEVPEPEDFAPEEAEADIEIPAPAPRRQAQPMQPIVIPDATPAIKNVPADEKAPEAEAEAEEADVLHAQDQEERQEEAIAFQAMLRGRIPVMQHNHRLEVDVLQQNYELINNVPVADGQQRTARDGCRAHGEAGSRLQRQALYDRHERRHQRGAAYPGRAIEAGTLPRPERPKYCDG